MIDRKINDKSNQKKVMGPVWEDIDEQDENSAYSEENKSGSEQDERNQAIEEEYYGEEESDTEEYVRGGEDMYSFGRTK